MQFHIITLFPGAFDSYLGESILRRAIKDKTIKVSFYNPRDFTKDKFRRIDRKPFGGGPGMVIEALPVIKAVETALKRTTNSLQPTKKLKNKPFSNSQEHQNRVKIIFLSPSGKQFDNKYARNLSKKYKNIVIVAGRYEGIDARVKKAFKMEEISVGPFILTGGELPAMIMIDAISRQVEGVLGNFDSREEARTASKDVYTRPEVFEYKGKKYRVPKILLSGHHKKIDEWKIKRNKNA